MRKTYKYRLYPTKAQVSALQASLDACRWIYNKTLETRKNAYEQEGKSLSLYATNALLPQWKAEKPDLANAFSQCLQNAQVRVDLAFKAFFRRVKAGEKPGYPRFKGYDRYDSITFPQFGFKLLDTKLRIYGAGEVKIRKHRPVEGIIKTCTIRRCGDKWYANFSVEFEPTPLPANNKAVGIDVGLESFATFSNKEKIANPRFFKKDEKELAKAQRQLSKQPKGSSKRKRSKRKAVKIHHRIKNRRHDFIHQTSRRIVNKFGVICIEKLNVRGMQHNRYLAKSIADVAWNQFAQILQYKAEEAGRAIALVNPRGTSQRCSQCGSEVKKTLAIRWHNCPTCGLKLHRDHNASLNVLAVGLHSLGLTPRSPRL